MPEKQQGRSPRQGPDRLRGDTAKASWPTCVAHGPSRHVPGAPTAAVSKRTPICPHEASSWNSVPVNFKEM